MSNCCICSEPIEKQLAGHNPAPVMDGDGDLCCGDCNATVVLPERLRQAVDRAVAMRVGRGVRSKPYIDDGTTEPPGAPLEGAP
jgi:hypothetical protein